LYLPAQAGVDAGAAKVFQCPDNIGPVSHFLPKSAHQYHETHLLASDTQEKMELIFGNDMVILIKKAGSASNAPG
jgi:hypothetical protein